MIFLKQNFIRTADKETAEKLISLGFQQIPDNSGSYYTFLNNQVFNFESVNLDEKKINYTNRICI